MLKLRTDLLKHLTTEDVIEGALANIHRYEPEPNFSKTGTGHLLSATPEYRAKEIERNRKLVHKLKQRAQAAAAKASAKNCC